jgi:lantibiotic biosynthesis protein
MSSASASPQSWFPVLEGEEAARAAAAVGAVAEAIGEDPLPAGAGYGDIALLRLERAIDAVASSTQSPGFYAGFTGVAWVAEHLSGGLAEGEDPNQNIDAALVDCLRRKPWVYDFDLTNGLVGYGVYALERLPRPLAVACLELVVEHLAEIAQPRPGGLAWYTPRDMLPVPNRIWFR